MMTTTTYGPFDATDYLESEAAIVEFLVASAEDHNADVLCAAIMAVARARIGEAFDRVLRSCYVIYSVSVSLRPRGAARQALPHTERKNPTSNARTVEPHKVAENVTVITLAIAEE